MALVQGERPLESGESISRNLPYEVGGPIPDRVEVAAGVWADGETFGQADWVKIILNTRDMRASEYEQASSLLRQRVGSEMDSRSILGGTQRQVNSPPIYAIRSTLGTNQYLNQKPQLLQHAVQTLLKSFAQKSELLRQAKPPVFVTTNS
jgi:hypothetical protein